MTAQQMLFYIGIAFFALAVIFVALAIWVFIAKNIPEVHADLTGKKRAREIREAASGQRSGSKKKTRKGSGKSPSGNPAESVVVSEYESGALRGETQTTSDLTPLQTTGDMPSPAQKPSQKARASVSAAEPPRAAGGYAYKAVSLTESKASKPKSGESPGCVDVANSTRQSCNDGSEETSLIGEDTEETSILVEETPDDFEQTSLLEEITEEVIEVNEARHTGEMPEGFQITTKIVLMEATDFIVAGQGEQHA